jgi:hypothetical protein
LFKVESLNRDGIVVHICVFFAEKRNRIKLHSNYGVLDMQSFLNDKTADPDNPGRRAASFIEDNYDAENVCLLCVRVIILEVFCTHMTCIQGL